MIKYNLCDFIETMLFGIVSVNVTFQGGYVMVDRLVGKKVVGVKQSAKAIKSGEGRTVYIAKDADSKLVDPVKQLAEGNSLEIVYVNTMKELGKLCGIEVGAATAVVLKD